SAPRIWLHPRPRVSGYQFVAEPLGRGVFDTLGTTDIVNGAFVPDRGKEAGGHGMVPTGRIGSDASVSGKSAIRNLQSTFHHPVRVFLASWQPVSRKRAVGLLHTPDVCWRMAGWSAMGLGQPRRASLRIAGRQLPMQSRVFASPDGADREFVLWGLLVDGQPLEPNPPVAAGFNPRPPGSAANPSPSASARLGIEPHVPLRASMVTTPKPPPPSSPFLERLREDLASRWEIARAFWQLVKRGATGTGGKQFLRVSVPLETDWQSALEQITAFVPQWLNPVESNI
ncbi:MAG: hypothetical protein KGS61_10865, partial [Verrucomicrobia bacterium]|nr:hypothetical protein [Verrucomicrobiota bacterium]